MITFEQVSFAYASKRVLDSLSFSLQSGELLAVMGESGCGKSTLLHLAAGLLKPQGGRILSDHNRISYAFQEPRLFPWMTVRENLLAVLPKERIQTESEKIPRILEQVGLSNAEDLYPNQLSGGMKSRASLARALLYDGDLFLLDECFASLDEALRAELTAFLREELKRKKKTAIFVTHLRSEAEAFSDHILTL
ncbi:MAG: ABC transporter ATP-binding protein [Clostridia bacterium]|jgi:NitT/TauT family transport system ATP-binding protein|nr:ABC transporter ATP-binding protein [Clostridia bacterium]MBQ1963186.1 ABC transporter ATP-binding protein [Clostridia bacterium]